MRPSSAKAKGRRLQQWVAEKLRHLFGWEEDDCRGAIMGESGMDIKLGSREQQQFPYAIECKNVERLNIWAAWDQANENCMGLHPMLIIKKNRTDTLAVVQAEHLFELVHELHKLRSENETTSH